LPKSDPDSNPNGVTSELERMPPAQSQGCVYLAGVTTEVYAQMQFPSTALYWGVSGSVTMKFCPAFGTIAWRQAELDVDPNRGSSWRNLGQAELDDPRAVKNSLLA
jgi:hypothetical protein